ncbi:MAG: protein-glutamate O-methyltransferase CheR [Planctomycetes bacterium]|nr:protein-glutamate O-methyltransferase CheR [Planctomycetota bacterium]
MATLQRNPEVEATEIQLLLEGMYRRYGVDYRDYSYGFVRRAVGDTVRAQRVRSVTALTERLLVEPACMRRLLLALSSRRTRLFSSPEFYRALRRLVVPLLRTHPFARLWVAGCAGGEEVYSLAILLREAGLAERSRIYGTELCEELLARARAGAYPAEELDEAAARYARAGGTRTLAEYFPAVGGRPTFDPALRRGLVFAQHNIVTDRSINEFHLILGRDLLVHLNDSLRTRVQQLLYDSIGRFGILALGAKDGPLSFPDQAAYERISTRHRLYRRIR